MSLSTTRPQRTPKTPLVSPLVPNLEANAENWRRVYQGGLCDNRALEGVDGVHTVRVLPPLKVTDDGIAIDLYDPSFQRGLPLSDTLPMDVTPGNPPDAGDAAESSRDDHEHHHGLAYTGGTEIEITVQGYWNTGDTAGGQQAGVALSVLTGDLSWSEKDATLTYHRRQLTEDYAGHLSAVTNQQNLDVVLTGLTGPAGVTGPPGEDGAAGGAGIYCVEKAIHYKGTNNVNITIEEADWRGSLVVGWMRAATSVVNLETLVDGFSDSNARAWPTYIVLALPAVVRCSNMPWPSNPFATLSAEVDATKLYLKIELANPRTYDGAWVAQAYDPNHVVLHNGTYWISNAQEGAGAIDVPGVAGNWTAYTMPEIWIHARICSFGQAPDDEGDYTTVGNVFGE